MAINFITSNKNKFLEAEAILGKDIRLKQVSIDLPEIQSLDSREIIECKLESARRDIGGEMFVEDTSLVIVGMNGLPGPLIKFFVKSVGIDGVYRLSSLFGKKAEAKVTIGYLDKRKKKHFFEGKLAGTIVEPRGDNGFMWDPVFIPKGHDKTFAEMTREEKNRVSHRKKAFLKLKKKLSVLDDIKNK